MSDPTQTGRHHETLLLHTISTTRHNPKAPTRRSHPHNPRSLPPRDLAPRRHLSYGHRLPRSLPRRRRRPRPPRLPLALRHRYLPRHQPRLHRLCLSHQLPHRIRALRVVLRLLGPPPTRAPQRARRRHSRRRTLVVQSPRRILAPSRRPRFTHRRPPQPPRRPRVVE